MFRVFRLFQMVSEHLNSLMNKLLTPVFALFSDFQKMLGTPAVGEWF